MNLLVWELTWCRRAWSLSERLGSICQVAVTSRQWHWSGHSHSFLSATLTHSQAEHSRVSPKPCSSCCWGQLVWNLMHVQFNQDPSHLRVLVAESKADLPWKSHQWLAVGPCLSNVTSQCFSFPNCETEVKLWGVVWQKTVQVWGTVTPSAPTTQNNPLNYIAFQGLVNIYIPTGTC